MSTSIEQPHIACGTPSSPRELIMEIAQRAIIIGDARWRDCAIRYLQCYANAAFRQWADERLREMRIEKGGAA